MLEEILETLKEIKNLLLQKENYNKDIEILFVKDIARLLKINLNEANKLWDREDFPGINIGHKKVEYSAFYKWLQEKRV